MDPLFVSSVISNLLSILFLIYVLFRFFELSFLNKCDETEKPIISEYLQRCFDIEIDDSVSNLVD